MSAAADIAPEIVFRPSGPRIVGRPAAAADIAALYGGPSPDTMRAWVLLIDGEPAALGGIIYAQGINPMAFSRLTDRARPYRRVLVQAARFLAARYAESRRPVFAVADPAEPTAPGLLEHLGFRLDAVVDEYRLFLFNPATRLRRLATDAMAGGGHATHSNPRANV